MPAPNNFHGTILALHATEQSTYSIPFVTYDDTGAAVVANSGLTWSLTDQYGNTVNGRIDVSITPELSMEVTLEGDDLAILTDAHQEFRVFTVEGTYDSDLGNGKPIKSQAGFWVDNLVKVS